VSLLFQSLFDGINIGSVLLISALGLAIVFGLMGVINLAHGELMMLGGYSTFVVQNIFKSTFGDSKLFLDISWFDLYIFAALPVAFIVAALTGLLLERGVIRFLYGRPLETLLATWGISLFLRQFVRSANWLLIICVAVFCLLFFGGVWFLQNKKQQWARYKALGIKNLIVTVTFILSSAIATVLGFLIKGNAALTKSWFSARNVDVTAPVWLRGGLPINNPLIGEFQLPYSRIFIICLTIICVASIYWFLNRSNWGLRIRSVTQNRSMSACLGIDTNKVDALTFALGSGLAGVAGCAISLLGSVGPNTGQNYIVDTFMVVVVGGVGNLLGTIIAALIIGITNYLINSGTIALLSSNIEVLKPITDFFNFFASTSMAKVMIFALIIAFLQVKPAGIFAPKGRTAEL
jgi:urea transport system permease protein